MLNVFITVVVIIVVLIIGIIGYASTKPDTFQVQRSITINATPEKIFPLINDFHQFVRWSPFETDPDMKRTFSGADEGVGSIYEFDSKDVGAGRITITGSTTPNEVDMKLEFFRPMKTTNAVVFTMQPEAGGTKVTWTMSGSNSLIAKVMQVFFSMDKMVGGSFEQGLASLKILAEKE